MYPSILKWLFTYLCKPRSSAIEFRYRSRLNLIIIPPTVLDNWRDKFIKTFNLKVKNPIELIIGYSAAPSTIRPSRLGNLAKL